MRWQGKGEEEEEVQQKAAKMPLKPVIEEVDDDTVRTTLHRKAE